MTSMDKSKIDSIKTWLGSGAINIFGTPFAGKDTQGKALAKLFGAEFISGGHIFRSQEKLEHMQQHIDSGKLVPTADYLATILPYLSQPMFANRPLILSSIGRWRGEEKAVMQALITSKHPVRAILLVTLDEKEIWQRWENAKHIQDRGIRADDHPEALKIRLEEYRDKTLPVIDFYRQKDLLIEVNGDQNPDVVTNEIIDKLYAFLATNKNL